MCVVPLKVLEERRKDKHFLSQYRVLAWLRERVGITQCIRAVIY